jgi:hypothetical protein
MFSFPRSSVSFFLGIGSTLVVHGIEINAALFERRVDTAAYRTGRLLVDDDHRYLRRAAAFSKKLFTAS